MLDLPGHGDAAAVRADWPGPPRACLRGRLRRASRRRALRHGRVLPRGLDRPCGHLGPSGDTRGPGGHRGDRRNRGPRRASRSPCPRRSHGGRPRSATAMWRHSSTAGSPARCSPDWAGVADVAERRRNTASGLASSLRLCGTGTQTPLWDALKAVDIPTLALAGTDDNRFAAHAVRVWPVPCPVAWPHSSPAAATPSISPNPPRLPPSWVTGCRSSRSPPQSRA